MEQVARALLRGRRAVQPPDPPTRSRIHGWHEEEEVYTGGRGGRDRGRGSDGGGGGDSSEGRDREKERHRRGRMNVKEKEEEKDEEEGGDEWVKRGAKGSGSRVAATATATAAKRGGETTKME